MELPHAIRLCLITSGLLVASCQPEQGVALADLEERISDLETKFAAVKRTATQLRREIVQISESRSTLESETDAARKAVSDVVVERNALVESFETYRADYHDAIIRRATGMKLGDVVVGTVTYRGTQVKALDAWEVSFHHNEGITRVDLVDLPQNLKALLGYDPTVGPKPAPELAVSSLTLPPMSDLASSRGSAGANATGPSSQPQRRSFAPVAKPLSNGRQSCDEGSEVLVRFMGVGASGSGSGGSTVKGGVSEVPQGYKPIGSSFSGSAMDREYKKNQR